MVLPVCTSWNYLLSYPERRREFSSNQVKRHSVDNGLGFYWCVVDECGVFVGFVHAFYKDEACRLVREFNGGWRVFGCAIAKCKDCL